MISSKQRTLIVFDHDRCALPLECCFYGKLIGWRSRPAFRVVFLLGCKTLSCETLIASLAVPSTAEYGYGTGKFWVSAETL
jgi:hypothetical protein